MSSVQSAVDGVQQSGVALGHADGVVLVGKLGVQDLQAGVGLHILLGGGVVDDDAVHLAVEQGLDSGGAVVIGGDVVLAVAAVLRGVGAVDVAGGAASG